MLRQHNVIQRLGYTLAERIYGAGRGVRGGYDILQAKEGDHPVHRLVSPGIHAGAGYNAGRERLIEVILIYQISPVAVYDYALFFIIFISFMEIMFRFSGTSGTMMDSMSHCLRTSSLGM